MTTYYESAEELVISKARAIKECQDHSVPAEDMFKELGEHDEYDAQAVLRFLGH